MLYPNMGTIHRIFNFTASTGDTCRIAMMVFALISCGAANGSAAAPSPSPTSGPAPAPGPPALGNWNGDEIGQLVRAASAAPLDALAVPDTRSLEAAVQSRDQRAINDAATALALKLARMHLFGVTSPAERAGWRIADTDNSINLETQLQQAMASGQIDAFFEGLQPTHPDYAVLRAAYAKEKDPARRKRIALNMERWRWMPRSLGPSYVLVNTASFEASLWRGGKRAGTWRIIAGKPSTPSPVFSARITGVTFNPWWEIPASIVREKHGHFPSNQGYVRTANGYRQRPGPKNSLGVMKLVMPNPFNVYMHDTPSKGLFARDNRAFSHGCIRVNDPLDFATALFNGSRNRADIDTLAAAGNTSTVGLPAPLPVYVTYFTATVLGNGTFAIEPDIYQRDSRMGTAFKPGTTECSGR